MLRIGDINRIHTDAASYILAEEPQSLETETETGDPTDDGKTPRNQKRMPRKL